VASLSLLCLGEPMIEFSQLKGDQYLRGFGGDTANCAVAAARHGASVGMLTRLGNDAFGQAFLDLWAREGVDPRHVVMSVDAHTGVYFVSHDASGHHFSYLRRDSAASAMDGSDIARVDFSDVGWLMLSGISLAISTTACDAAFEAMSAARAHGVRIALDTNLRLALWPLQRARAVLREAATLADLVLPGDEDAAQLTGFSDPDAIVDHYLGLGCSTVALTLGVQGALVATADERQHLAAHRVDAIDATGAGDAFDGAFLARVIAGDSAMVAARYANIAAALSTQGHGAVAPLPRACDVHAVIAAADA
jgi:2-dehydro-3-deoxygluconokinase